MESPHKTLQPNIDGKDKKRKKIHASEQIHSQKH